MKHSYWTTKVSLPTDIAERVLSLTGGSDLHDLSYGIQVLCSRFSETYSNERPRSDRNRLGDEVKCDSCQECGCNTDVCKCECHKQDDKDQLDFWEFWEDRQ